MLAVAALALSLSQSPASAGKLDQLAESATAEAKAEVVLLDCQVASRGLTACRAVNEASAAAAAEAIRLAEGIQAPDALTAGAHIRIKMNVTP